MGFDADLLIVGGGPAGLTTALYARRAGLTVIVAEPRSGDGGLTPIDKACGEGLMPGGLARLRALGVDPPGVDFRGITYLDAGQRVDAPFRAGPGRGVRRTTLHSTLRIAAQAAGTQWTPARITQLRQDADGVEAGGLRARWLVGADGLHSTVRRLVGQTPVAGAPRRYGLRRHYHLAPWSHMVEVWWAPHAEAYVTPVAADTVGVAVLHRRGAHASSYQEMVDGFPALARRLAGAEPASTVQGAGPLRQIVRSRVHGRVLLVGDAAGYEDALTGEGISLAAAQAEAAVAALVAGNPVRYEATWREVTRRYRWLTRGLVLATMHRPGRRLLVPACATAPFAFRGIVNLLAG
jgi:flavin-dependent dehydrogenase